MFNLQAIQAALKDFGFDGWLLHDFRGSNILARRILDLDPDSMGSRRLYFFVPANGEPKKLVHRIESAALDHLPGSKTVYLRWQELEAGLTGLVKGCKKVALEYSPRNAIPYVSKLDSGTAEVLRGAGVELASSGDLIQLFEAAWDDEQWEMHLEAAKHTRSAYDRAFGYIATKVRSQGSVREMEVRQVIMDHFKEHKMTTYHPPIVGVGPHSGDPHYENSDATNTAMKEGDFVLIDLWAKMDRPRSVYSDLTQVGFVGKTVPAKYEDIFRIVAAARDAAIKCVHDAYGANRRLPAWEVDDAARNVIDKAGYGQYFVHRTGHNIGQEVHGNGANMDNLETHEERLVLRRTCFSVEPGIYLAEFGVRSEVNVFVDKNGNVHVTGGEPQKNVLPILSAF
jgi:Xaa-Pro aminopeptidase